MTESAVRIRVTGINENCKHTRALATTPTLSPDDDALMNPRPIPRPLAFASFSASSSQTSPDVHTTSCLLTSGDALMLLWTCQRLVSPSIGFLTSMSRLALSNCVEGTAPRRSSESIFVGSASRRIEASSHVGDLSYVPVY
jgi:hypothetical protein